MNLPEFIILPSDYKICRDSITFYYEKEVYGDLFFRWYLFAFEGIPKFPGSLKKKSEYSKNVSFIVEKNSEYIAFKLYHGYVSHVNEYEVTIHYDHLMNIYEKHEFLPFLRKNKIKNILDI